VIRNNPAGSAGRAVFRRNKRARFGEGVIDPAHWRFEETNRAYLPGLDRRFFLAHFATKRPVSFDSVPP